MKPEEIKQYLLRKHKKVKFSNEDFLSTGSTMLNLACTDKPDRGYIKGHYYRLVGDSRSGKTFLCLTCLAEASINPNFDNYRLIYDNVEKGALMDFQKYFGTKAASRIEPPAKDKRGNEKYSITIEEFYYNLSNALKNEKPCIYVLDSETSISSEKEHEEFEENKKAHESNKMSGGSYGDGKAKVHSSHLRLFIEPLQSTGSILLVVSQTRDNIGGYGGKSVSGGWALLFYAGLEIWCSVLQTISKTVMGKKREQGTLCKIRIKKNRISGKDRNLTLPIYPSYGIDDIGSCVDYLISENHWKKSGQTIKATEFNIEAKREKIIRYVEKNNKENELREIVSKVWNEIEEAVALKRKKRYE